METNPFEFVAHTADVAVVVRGTDVADLMTNAACALYHLTVSEPLVAAVRLRRVVVDSVDRDALLVDWLNELVYLLFAEGLVFCRFRFMELGDERAVVDCWGDYLERHGLRITREVKAATHHMAHITCDGEGLVARIIFDV